MNCLVKATKTLLPKELIKHAYVCIYSISIHLFGCLSTYLPTYHLCIYPYLEKNNDMVYKLLPYLILAFQKSCKVNRPWGKKSNEFAETLEAGATICHCTTNKWCREFNPHLFPPLFPPFADSMPATLIYNCFQRVSGTPPSGLCSDPPPHLECFPLRYLIHSPRSSLFKFHLGKLILSTAYNLDVLYFPQHL